MENTSVRQLGPFSLAVLLVSAHYGLGFLLGTAEQAFILGSAGSLYAFSVAMGTVVLLALAGFYWQAIEQIWTLIGDRYGSQAKLLIGVMAWLSLIGIEAAQIISGAYILKVFGLPVLPCKVGLALLFAGLALLPVERLSWVFRGLLLANLMALLYGLWVLHGGTIYAESVLRFIPTVEEALEPSQILGITGSTLLLILIDMKYQQFLVRARDRRSLYLGCSLAAIALIALSFLPTAVVVAAQRADILPPDLGAKETIPYILGWIGGGVFQPLGMTGIAALIVPALGVGSNVLRIQTKTMLDFKVLPAFPAKQVLLVAINGLLGLAVALKGGEIVGLIVCFYAAYVAASWVPFAAYLLEHWGGFAFSTLSVRVALVSGSAAAIAELLLSLFWPDLILFGSAELNIMLLGLCVGSLGLVGTQTLSLVVSLPTLEKET